jgi:hypothetical protein
MPGTFSLVFPNDPAAQLCGKGVLSSFSFATTPFVPTQHQHVNPICDRAAVQLGTAKWARVSKPG